MSNFLEDLKIPQLGKATFQTEFNAFCSAIKNNFERLVSVQFTKGNDGNSVVTKHITIDKDLNENDTMSNLSFQIVKSIYKLEGDTPITIGDFKQALEGTSNQFGDPDNGGIAPSFYDAYSFPQLQTIPTQGIEVDIVLDEHNGKAYMAVPYIFIDGRISELSRYKREHADDEDIYKTFHDWSTAVFGEGEFVSNVQDIQDWNWETNSMDIVPKLYFDPNIGEFCWEVNGQQTGVTAQGVKGNDGIASNVFTAKGIRSDNRIVIESIQYVNDDGTIYWLQNKERLEDIKNYVNGEETIIRSVKFSDNEGQTDASIILRDTDFLLVFYRNGEDPESPYDKAFLGKPYMEVDPASTWIYVYYEEGYDIFQNILDQNFRDMLNGIYDSNNIADLRGIYIPGRSQKGENPTQYHMTYSESPTKMHSAIVNYNDTQGDADEPTTQEIGDWLIDYNTQVQGTLGVQGDVTMRNDACVQGNLTVQGNIEAESINVVGHPFRGIQGLRPAVVSTFKDVDYKLERLVDKNDHQAIQGYQGPINTNIGYKVTLNANLNLKVGLMSNSTYNSTNANRQMHKMVGRYGAQYQDYGYMWDDSDVADKTKEDAQAITTQGNLYNAPKLYDVIEYDIPITFERTKYPLGIISQGYYPYIEPYDSTSITLQGVFIGIKNYMSSPLSFDDISYRVLLQGLPSWENHLQSVDYFYDKGNTLDLPDVDVFAYNYYQEKTFIPGALQSLVEYSQQIPYESYTFKGILDYKGIQLKYFVDIFCRIQEIIGRGTIGDRLHYLTNNSNVSLILSPIGYIEYEDGYKSPIYGNEIVTNKSQDNIDGNSSNKRRKIQK